MTEKLVKLLYMSIRTAYGCERKLKSGTRGPGNQMRGIKRLGIIASLASIIFLASTTSAQQSVQIVSQRNHAYDVSRETSLDGTVVNYTAASAVPPMGAHVILQTNSGVVEVHLGNSKLLEANHFTLSAGDSIHVMGENIFSGTSTQFVARVIQKGNQSVLLRSPRGFPLVPMVKGAGKTPKAKAGVL